MRTSVIGFVVWNNLIAVIDLEITISFYLSSMASLLTELEGTEGPAEILYFSSFPANNNSEKFLTDVEIVGLESTYPFACAVVPDKDISRQLVINPRKKHGNKHAIIGEIAEAKVLLKVKQHMIDGIGLNFRVIQELVKEIMKGGGSIIAFLFHC